MKIFFDISAVRNPLTGIGRYAYELATHLAKNHNELELEFIAGRQRSSILPQLPIPNAGKSSASPLDYARERIARSPVAAQLHQYLLSARQSQILRKESGVFHNPQFHLPRLNMPGVVTIHDLSVYKCADYHPESRVKTTRKLIENAAIRSSHLITDSEFTRQEVIQHFGLPNTAVTAVHLACSRDFRPRTANETVDRLRFHDLTHGGYTFYSGTIEPRKNLHTLIDAYSRLPHASRMQYPLVLCGHHGWKSESLHTRIQRHQSEGWLRYLGYVDEATLPVLFAGARLFVYPSLYEGFGLPVLEAMTSATPVICSTSTSLPEIAGNAAALFDPLDTESLFHLLQQGLDDTQWQDTARAKGLAQAAQFSWQRCARETAQIYNKVSKV